MTKPKLKHEKDPRRGAKLHNQDKPSCVTKNYTARTALAGFVPRY